MKTLCIQRINKDLKEITNSPLEGIGIASLENDPMKYVVNMKIMSGVYEGYCIQLYLTFPDNYPIKPPKILIYPGQSFDNIYHHHIYRADLKDENDRHFNKFCFDLLDNDFLPTSSEKSGWNPSYTISSLLLQVQTFLSKPDFPTGYIPPKEKIDELMKSMETYEKSFIIKDENTNEDIIKIHTWKNPYPEMYFKNNEDINENKENKESDKIKEIKEDLTCYISRLNYIDDKNLLLGYPIKKIKSNCLIPIPEILSYECFIQESSKDNHVNNHHSNLNQMFINFLYNNNFHINNNIFVNDPFIDALNFYNLVYSRHSERLLTHIEDVFLHNSDNNNGLFKSANNEFYDTWLPIYINEEHFKKNKTTILNYFSILKFGNYGLKKYDFHPQYIFEILPKILAEMINKIEKENTSSSFIKCFFQYILMFKKLEKEYNNIFMKYQKYFMEIKINKFLKENKKINLKNEMLELLILFYLSDNKFNENMKQKFMNYLIKLRNLIFLNLFENEDFIDFKDNKEFIKDLKMNNLFNKIVDIIFMNSDFLILIQDLSLLCLSEILRNKVIEQMNLNFRDLYINLNEEIKQRIKKLLLDKINFSNYFNQSDFISYISFPKEMLKSIFCLSSEFSNYISIINSIREKVLNKSFLEELENNYGIYSNNETFIEEINKIKENYEKIDNIIKDVFGNQNINKFKNAFLLQTSDYLTFSFSCFREYRYIFNADKGDNYPFIKINGVGNYKIITISRSLKALVDKDKAIYHKNIKKFFNKKEIIKDKIIKKIKRDRIDVKKSYNKNYNKSLQRYNFKQYR